MLVMYLSHPIAGEYSIEAKNATGVCKSDYLIKVLPPLPGEEPKAKKTLPPLAKAPKIVKLIKPLTSVAPGATSRYFVGKGLVWGCWGWDR